jgi:uncharacterized repeat protein (TIGR03806 family)
MSLYADEIRLVFGARAGSMNPRGGEQGGRVKTFLRGIATIACCASFGACHSSDDDPPPTNPPNNPPPPGVVVGLDARPSNTSCVAPAKSSNAGATIAVTRVFPNLTFTNPVSMLQAPGDDARWFVLEKGGFASTGTGRVRVFANEASVSTMSTFASVAVNASSEGGLLGMAFHPSFATNGYVYLSFTEGSPMASRIARYTVAGGGATLNMATRTAVISVNQPYDNHNGGNIAFSPTDGYLYAGFGDGGGGGDPESTGQDTTDLLGSFLRLDVDGAAPYAIPPDNPFAGQAMCTAAHTPAVNDCPETYASGFRNPWRWSFDRANGDLWVGDVGQGAFEEIDRVARGGNYGWNCREGRDPYSGAPAMCGTLPAATFTDPVHQYGRNLGFSVTGGFVYRGSALPALVGSYLFADYGSGRIWRLTSNGSGGFTSQELLDTNLGISSFGEGNDGELYVVDLNGGGLYKIVDGAGATPGPPVPTLLSDTGCVVASNPSAPASGLVPYDVAAAFWSDGAVKERWIGIPNGTSISVGGDGDFTFPNGTVLMKHFRLGTSLIETRLFMRHPDGEWAGYSYEWDSQQTNATLVQGGKTVAVGGQNWIFPSGNDCLTCHTSAAGFALGLESAQLNHDFTYASTGRTANELRTLDSVAMFTTPLGDPALQPAMPSPSDTTAPLGARARAYLHTNCAQCHRQGGPTPVSMDLHYATLLSSTAACDAAPTAGDLGLGASARIIAPGNPDASVLLERMEVARGDANQMPPLATNAVDTAGVTLIRDWIASLTTCQ